jgi:hypothetical protein
MLARAGAALCRSARGTRVGSARRLTPSRPYLRQTRPSCQPLRLILIQSLERTPRE